MPSSSHYACSDLVPPTWGGSLVIFTRQSPLSGRMARVPVTGSSTLRIGN